MDTQQKIKMTPLPDDILEDSKYDLLDELKEKSKQCANIIDKFCYKTLTKLGYKGFLTEEIKLKKFVDENKISIIYGGISHIIYQIKKDGILVSMLIIYNFFSNEYREEFFI